MLTSVQLREKRATIVNSARELTNKAHAENRDLSAEEQQTFDRAMEDVDKLEREIKAAEREGRLAAAENSLDRPVERRGRLIDETVSQRERGLDPAGASARREAFRHWLMTGDIPENIRSNPRTMAELRDTIISTDSKGGYLIAPVEISDDIVKGLNDAVFVRALCEAAGSIKKVKAAKALGVRKRTTRMSDANWTTEVQAVSEDTTGAFGRRDLTPVLLSKLAKVSILTLMQAVDAESEINDELVYKFGVTEEKAYLTGSGSAQPLGVFIADANGISTARDVTAAGATAITGDDLINVKYSLKAQYRRGPGVSWILNRNVIKVIRKLKISASGVAGEFQYVWQPGLTAGAPDTLLDLPLNESEYAPGTITTGLYTAVLGNFRFYRIAEVADIMFTRLNELYQGTNEIGVIGRRWLDGAPVLEEAFARLKQA